jgi:hypothetical protein
VRKIDFSLFGLFVILAISACNKIDAPEANGHAPSSPSVTVIKQQLDGTFCFNKVWNKDITDIQLTIAGDVVTGVMNWIPYQKDGARGTLKGTKNAAGEFDLMYDYMIEGSQQTETKIMKIEDGKLLVKVGELLDPNYDGRLIYKDVNQAKYSEILDKIDC